MGSPIDWNAWFAQQQQQNPTLGGIAGMGGAMGQMPMPPPPGMPGPTGGPTMGAQMGATAPVGPVGQIGAGPAMAKPTAAIGGPKPTREQAQWDMYAGMIGQQPGLENVTRQRALAEALRQGGGKAMSTRVTQGSRGAPNIEQAPTGWEMMGQLAQSAGSAYAGSKANTEAERLDKERAEIMERARGSVKF